MMMVVPMSAFGKTDENGLWCSYVPLYEHYHEQKEREPLCLATAGLPGAGEEYNLRDDFEAIVAEATSSGSIKLDLYFDRFTSRDDDKNPESREEAFSFAKPFALSTVIIPNYNLESVSRYWDDVEEKGGFSKGRLAGSCTDVFTVLLDEAIKTTKNSPAGRFSALIHLAATTLARSASLSWWPSYFYAGDDAARAKLLNRLFGHLKKLWLETDETLGFVDVLGQSSRVNCEAFMDDVLEWQSMLMSGVGCPQKYSWKPGKRAIANHAKKIQEAQAKKAAAESGEQDAKRAKA